MAASVSSHYRCNTMLTTGEMAEWSKAPDSKSAGELRSIKALREFLSATLPRFLPKSWGHGRKLRVSFPTLVIPVHCVSKQRAFLFVEHISFHLTGFLWRSGSCELSSQTAAGG
jgi:hypothetical protein